MDTSDKITILCRMKRDYFKSLFMPWRKQELHTSTGLCYYLGHIAPSGKPISTFKTEILKEFRKTKPSLTPEYGHNFWYYEGRAFPRLRLIIKTLRRLEKKHYE